MAKITPCMENGKITVVPELPDSICFGSTEFHVIRPETGIDPRWISNFLLQHEVRRAAQRSMAGGVGQMRVPGSFVAALNIPVPPRAEVQRIFTELDELLPNLDAAVAGLERAQKKLPLYRAAVLKAAVEGNLTAEWRCQHQTVEPASELLSRILAKRRKRWEEEQLRKFSEAGKKPPRDWKGQYREPITPETKGLPPLPPTWAYASVQQLGDCGEQAVLTGPFGTSLGRSDFADAGVPVLTIGCLTEDGISLRSARHISLEKARTLNRYRLQPGDLLFSRMASIGRAGFVTKDFDGAVFNYHLMRLRLEANAVLPIYFLTYVRGAAQVVRYLKAVNHGATRDGINTEQLLRLPVALPPLEEQKAIIDEIEDQISLLVHLEADLALKFDATQALRHCLLRDAFSGHLLAQDPKDERASELLKRIAVEREQRERRPKSANSAIKNRRGAPDTAKAGA